LVNKHTVPDTRIQWRRSNALMTIVAYTYLYIRTGSPEIPFSRTQNSQRQRRNSRKFPSCKKNFILHTAISKSATFIGSNYNDGSVGKTLRATLVNLVFKSPCTVTAIHPSPMLIWPGHQHWMQNHNRLVRQWKPILDQTLTNWMRNRRVSTRNKQVERACCQTSTKVIVPHAAVTSRKILKCCFAPACTSCVKLSWPLRPTSAV